jgi:hypothetical protein
VTGSTGLASIPTGSKTNHDVILHLLLFSKILADFKHTGSDACPVDCFWSGAYAGILWPCVRGAELLFFLNIKD